MRRPLRGRGSSAARPGASFEQLDFDPTSDALTELSWLLSPLDEGAMLNKALEAVGEATGVDISFAGAATGPDAIRITTLHAALTDSLLDLEVLPGRGLGGQALARHGAVTTTDYRTDTAITDDYRPRVAPEDLGGLIAVPIVGGGRLRGMLWAGNRAPTEFGDRIIDAVVRTGNELAFAMTLAERTRYDIELAVAEERRRLAIALHDSVGALLFTIRASISNLDRRAHDDAELHAQLADLESHAGQAASALRSSLQALHATASEIVLEVALRTDAHHFEQRSGVRAHLALTTELPALAPANADALVAAVREALVNVEKHAHAQSVVITAFAIEDAVSVLVADDGVGIDDSADAGIGLSATRERLERVGGTLSLTDNGDGGATLCARVPR